MQPLVTLASTLLAFALTGTLVRVQAQTPDNDNFANRLVLEGESVFFSGTAYGATAEATDPLWPSEGNSASVWWSWTSPVSGFAAIRIEQGPGTKLEPSNLVVFQGSDPEGLKEVQITRFCHGRL